MTNVFISWSGEKSKAIAEELRSWIPSVLQFARPYFTPNDLEKGTKWNTEISERLAETHVGIVCLTPENFERPWILFEAGALSKDLDRSKVCSVLFGMENTDLTGPLTTFQTTAFEKSDFKKLMKTIKEAGEDRALLNDTLNTVFEKWWPDLEKKVTAILEKPNSTGHGEVRSERDLLEEILDLSRMSARRNAASRRERTSMPPGWVASWLDSISEVLSFYEERTDSELSVPIKQQIELVEYLLTHDDRLYQEFVSKVDRIKDRFGSVIPF